MLEVRVIVTEPGGAHVLDEDVGAGRDENWLDVHVAPLFGGCETFEFKDHVLHFAEGGVHENVVLRRGDSGGAVGAGDGSSCLLQIGPVA